MSQRVSPESTHPVGIGWTGVIMSGHVTITISEAPDARLSPVTRLEACSGAVS